MKEKTTSSKKDNRKLNKRWRKDYFYLKHQINFSHAMHIISFVLKTIILLASFVAILWFSKIIIISSLGKLSFNYDFQTEYIKKEGLLGIQITLTLICVSLIALVSNIQKKYIYGESLLDLAFPSKILSFKFAMIVLFSLLIVNVFLMLTGMEIVYVITIFLSTLYTSTIILYRFASVFLSQRSLKNRLMYKYYKDNLEQLKRTRPIDQKESQLLRKLKVIALENISQKDYISLNENMTVHFNLLKTTLFNHRNAVIEYYTEYYTHQDIIGHINDISIELLYKGEPLYGLEMYNALLRHINYFNVICVEGISFTSSYFIKAFIDIKDRTQSKLYLNNLLYMSKMLIRQSCLYSTTDLGFCRLGKSDGLIYYFAQYNMYEQIYNLIEDSTIFSIKEKEEMIESIRTNIIDVVSDLPFLDVEDFKKNQLFHKEKRIYSLEIKGEPIALLFIRFFELCDYKSLNNYNSLWIVYEKKQEFGATYAILLTMLSVINSLHLKGKRTYMYDIKVDNNTAKTVFHKCKLLYVPISDKLLDSYYEFITNHYIVNEDGNTSKSGIYGFNPKFYYKKEVVDMLFAYFYKKNHQEKNIQEISKEKGLIYRKGIEKIILKMDPLYQEKKIV